MEMTSVFCEWGRGRQEKQAGGVGGDRDCLAVGLSGRESSWHDLAALPSSSPGSTHLMFSESRPKMNSQSRAIHSSECRTGLTTRPSPLLWSLKQHKKIAHCSGSWRSPSLPRWLEHGREMRQRRLIWNASDFNCSPSTSTDLLGEPELTPITSTPLFFHPCITLSEKDFEVWSVSFKGNLQYSRNLKQKGFFYIKSTKLQISLLVDPLDAPSTQQTTQNSTG